MAIEALDIEIRHFSGTAATDIDALGQALLRLKKRVENINAETLAKRFEHLDAAIKRLDASNLERVARAVEGITGGMRGLNGRSLSRVRDASEQASRGLDRVRQSTRNVGNEARRSSSPVGKFASMVGRMALYRAIRAALKLITQSIKEGVQNLAKWDYLTGRVSSSKAYDTLQQYGSKFTELKNSIGAAAMPILQILLPAFNALADGAIRAFNAINALFSALGGSVKYTAATAETGYNLADSFGAAGGAASKLKATILGFDELNVMNDPTGGGGGGGSSAFGGITESTFEDRDLPEWVNKFDKAFASLRDSAERIKDAIAKIGDSEAWSWVKLIFNETVIGLANLFASAVEALSQGLAFIADIFNGDWEQAWKDFWNADWMTGLADMLRDAHDRIAEFFGGDDGSWSPFVALADGLDALANAFEKLAKTNPGEIWESIKNWFSKPVTFEEGSIVNIDEILGLNKAREFFSKPIEIESGSVLDVDSWLSGIGDKLAKFFTGELVEEQGAHGGSGVAGKFSIISAMREIGMKSAPAFAEGFNGQISKENLHADVRLEPSIKINQNTIDSKFGSSSGATSLKLPMTANLVWWQRDRSKWTSDWDRIDYTANLNNWQRDRTKWTSDWDRIDYTANLNNWQKDPTKWRGDNWNNINFKANLNDWQKDPDKWKGASWNNIDFNANIVKVIPPTKTEQISVNAKIDKVITPDGKFTLTKAAKGGAFYGGGWHSIPQYADGGAVHGSLFLAGEAGPEIVGHVGGRTEVLNSSQLAATMAAAVSGAMGGNNALLREQNGLLREMASRESTVRAVVSTSDIASGAARMNRRAGTTIIPVGA